MTQITPAWNKENVLELFGLSFNDLLARAHEIHRKNWDANQLQLSTLISIKTGNCTEDCKYCSQSRHYKTKLEPTDMMSLEDVADVARKAQESGAERMCMGASGRGPKERDMPALQEIVSKVKSFGLETCMTLGMVSKERAQQLKQAGLDYYNHNLDTSEEYYGNIVTTRTFQDRLDTLDAVRKAGIKVCSGGILGMGEERRDRASMISTLASLTPPPESVPINVLVPIPGTPLEGTPKLDPLELVRTVAVARITMPASRVRLSAGRETVSEECQALCFFAGANSVFYGDRLLTTENLSREQDDNLFEKLGLKREGHVVE